MDQLSGARSDLDSISHAGLSDEKSGKTRLWIEREAIARLAGPEAERRFSGKDANGEEIAAVHELALHLFGETAGQAYFDFLVAYARQILDVPHRWLSVETVAAALIEKTSLSDAELREVIQGAIVSGAKKGQPAPVSGHASESGPDETEKG